MSLENREFVKMDLLHEQLLKQLAAAEKYIGLTWKRVPLEIDAVIAWNEWRKTKGEKVDE